ncbi:MAG: DUF4282 domain-containing protein [Candidatus Bipolaricaulota bacterium]
MENNKETMNSNWWRDFLAFRRYITPTVMPVVFWIGVALITVVGLATIIAGARARAGLAPRMIAWGIVVLFVGPLLVRIACEVVMTFFRREK